MDNCTSLKLRGFLRISWQSNISCEKDPFSFLLLVVVLIIVVIKIIIM